MKGSVLILSVFVFVIFSVFQCSSRTDKVDSEKMKIDDDTTAVDIDSRLRLQLLEYLTAFNNGDGEKAIKYVYPGTLDFLKTQYPAEYNEEQVKIGFKKMIDSFKESIEKSNSKYEFEIGEIKKRIEYKSDLIYIVETFVHVSKDLNKQTLGERTIGFSADHGFTWTFLTYSNGDAETILRYKYPESIINSIKEKY